MHHWGGSPQHIDMLGFDMRQKRRRSDKWRDMMFCELIRQIVQWSQRPISTNTRVQHMQFHCLSTTLSPSYPSAGPHVCERRVLTETQSPKGLHGPVYHPLGHAGCHDLDACDLRLGCLFVQYRWKAYCTLEGDTKKDDGGIMRVMARSVYNTDTIE